MKKPGILSAVLLAIALSSFAVPRNEQKTQEWLENAAKPVYVQHHSFNGLTHNDRYTLIDQNGRVFFTKDVRFHLPDTIPGR